MEDGWQHFRDQYAPNWAMTWRASIRRSAGGPRPQVAEQLLKINPQDATPKVRYRAEEGQNRPRPSS